MANLILGLGGTGAKIVESFIHLCATGLGPDEPVSVAFIDQDLANGNTHRSGMTLIQYMRARDALRDDENPSRCDLFRTKLVPHSATDAGKKSPLETCHWKPQGEDDACLSQLIQYESQQDNKWFRGLAEALFLKEAELDMELHEGYRGRPHVGSAALLLNLESDTFWKSIKKLVMGVGNDGARVFLCGSAFGGTGAAVLPTLARSLRGVAKKENKTLLTGASLMLPYFTFDPPPDNSEANVAEGDKLALQSQSALRYYHSDIQNSQETENNSFDDLYLVGWDPLIHLKYHQAGSGKQVNPPLAPELFGALAATKFFRENREDGEGTTSPSLHFISRNDELALTWDDLPKVPNTKLSVKKAYATWLRFNALWYFDYSQVFPSLCTRSEDTRFRKAAEGPAEAWFRRHVGGAEISDDSVKALDEYIATALRYAAAMSKFSKWGSNSEFELWGSSPIAELEEEVPQTRPRLAGGKLAGKNLSDFQELIRGFTTTPDAADVYWALVAAEKPGKQQKGLWTLIANLHKCSTP